MDVNYEVMFPNVYPEGMSKCKAGEIISGVFYPYGSVSKYFYDQQQEYNHTHKQDKNSENKFRNSIVDKLKKEGWKVETESYTSQGRIDILARKNDEIMLIETKMKSNSNDCSHALGQLLFYSKFHPGCKLFISTPAKPDLTILSILKSFGVEYYEGV
jgi:hypothetical protein